MEAAENYETHRLLPRFPRRFTYIELLATTTTPLSAILTLMDFRLL